MDKFRVISDLHLDVNAEFGLKLRKDDVFTLVAGDISGRKTVVTTSSNRKAVRVDVCNESEFFGYFRITDGSFKMTCSKTADGKVEWSWGNGKVDFARCGVTVETKDEELRNGDCVTFRMTDTRKWLRKNVKRGLFVAGNHLVYTGTKEPIEDLKKELAEQFKADDSLTFLEQSTGVMAKEVDGILFVGTTLYTDYRLPFIDWKYGSSDGRSEDAIVEMNMRFATPKMSGGGLNDFSYGRTYEGTYVKNKWDFDSDGKGADVYYLTPTNCKRFFERSFEAIKSVVEANPDKDIVILTHHCPSPKCISEKYVTSNLNASYVSDLESFITDHPNIRCWVCGHVHHRASFKVGGCTVVMNPLGYCSHGEYTHYPNEKDAIDWTPDCFVDTKTWEVERKPYRNEKWDKLREEKEKARMEWYRKFGGIFF